MPHFVYMLQCAGNHIYTGYTTDIEERFKKHREGTGARFTRAFPPEKILRVFELETKSEALRLEAKIKAHPRKDKEAFVQIPKEETDSWLADFLKKKG